jgi:pyridoxamine 5'-phosphate oxidase
MRADVSKLREDYRQHGLHRADLAEDPIAQFDEWFHGWLAIEPYDAAAMTVATAGADGQPDVRYVLCRGYDRRGFVFYTNYTSVKATQLEANPRAALCFGWLDLARQVRVRGTVERVDDAESDEYWAGRPRGSRVGAWASDQSEVVANRAELDRHLSDVEQRFGEGDVPRPDFWGGFRVVHQEVEFWQGQTDRLHDRFRYRRNDRSPTGWDIDRLSP